MIITNFKVKVKINRSKFFQKIFPVSDTKFEIILKMFFLKISNADVLFDDRKFI